jgi:hypothetical protein
MAKTVPKILLLLISIVVLACANKKEEIKNETYKIVEVAEDNTTPTVDLKKYRLIENGSEDRKQDAKQILKLKRTWPLVMQSPSRIGFDTLLSRNFTFSGDGNLLNREDYITDRIKPSDWKITHVKYDNLTLQFFGNTALLTYRNEVTNEHINTKEVEIEYISWADLYVLENRKWKIGASHTVDVRIEKN